MDYAREINPNFFILGELFTSSETLNHLFINKLGINTLVLGKSTIVFFVPLSNTRFL